MLPNRPQPRPGSVLEEILLEGIADIVSAILGLEDAIGADGMNQQTAEEVGVGRAKCLREKVGCDAEIGVVDIELRYVAFSKSFMDGEGGIALLRARAASRTACSCGVGSYGLAVSRPSYGGDLLHVASGPSRTGLRRFRPVEIIHEVQRPTGGGAFFELDSCGEHLARAEYRHPKEEGSPGWSAPTARRPLRAPWRKDLPADAICGVGKAKRGDAVPVELRGRVSFARACA